MIVSAGSSGFQINPRAMHCAGGATGFFRLRFTEALLLILQLCREPRTLLGIIAEKRLELRIFHRIGGFFEAFLTVFKCLDQTVNRRNNCFLLCHITYIASRTSVAARKFLKLLGSQGIDGTTVEPLPTTETPMRCERARDETKLFLDR